MHPNVRNENCLPLFADLNFDTEELEVVVFCSQL